MKRLSNEVQELAGVTTRNLAAEADGQSGLTMCRCDTYWHSRQDHNASCPTAWLSQGESVAAEYLRWHWYGGGEPYINEVRVLGKAIATAIADAVAGTQVTSTPVSGGTA